MTVPPGQKQGVWAHGGVCWLVRSYMWEFM